MNNFHDWLKVGTVVGVHGLKGEIKVNPSSDFPERFTDSGPRWLRKGTKEEIMEMQLIGGRQLPGKSLFVVKFATVVDRNTAEKLIGLDMLVMADDRPKLNEGEFHLLDLLGLDAQVLKNGEIKVLGNVTDLISGGNELLEISCPDGRKLLIPFVKEIVPELNLKEGFLSLTPPPGLLDL